MLVLLAGISLDPVVFLRCGTRCGGPCQRRECDNDRLRNQHNQSAPHPRSGTPSVVVLHQVPGHGEGRRVVLSQYHHRQRCGADSGVIQHLPRPIRHLHDRILAARAA